ncbi:MAG: hypothetical protein IIZ57_07915 [Solobacterium sp.]|nr:hypothetical protein [Solobacterium sp.]
MDAKKEAADKLISVLMRMGYPREFGALITQELHSEKMINRMTSYLLKAKPGRPEEIVDEMLAIKSDTEQWIRKKKAEYTNRKINEYLNRPDE